SKRRDGDAARLIRLLGEPIAVDPDASLLLQSRFLSRSKHDRQPERQRNLRDALPFARERNSARKPLPARLPAKSPDTPASSCSGADETASTFGRSWMTGRYSS